MERQGTGGDDCEKGMGRRGKERKEEGEGERRRGKGTVNWK